MFIYQNTFSVAYWNYLLICMNLFHIRTWMCFVKDHVRYVIQQVHLSLEYYMDVFYIIIGDQYSNRFHIASHVR